MASAVAKGRFVSAFSRLPRTIASRSPLARQVRGRAFAALCK